jgi:hypothetical protein
MQFPIPVESYSEQTALNIANLARKQSMLIYKKLIEIAALASDLIYYKKFP